MDKWDQVSNQNWFHLLHVKHFTTASIRIFLGIGIGKYCKDYITSGTREEGTVYSLHSFFRKLAQGIGPSIVLLIMGALGYVSELGTIGQSFQTSKNMCWLVAGLYMFSAVLQFVGLAVIYNLDKKTLATMTTELEANRAAKAE